MLSEVEGHFISKYSLIKLKLHGFEGDVQLVDEFVNDNKVIRVKY